MLTQNHIDQLLKDQRKNVVANNDQLTLGELIEQFEPLVKKYEEDDVQVMYDFEYFFPNNIDSWRGIYAELALNIEFEGSPMKSKDFLKMLKESVGKTFQGYKGGSFTMGNDTPIWVANCGNSGNTAVVGVHDVDYQIILMTGYRES